MQHACITFSLRSIAFLLPICNITFHEIIPSNRETEESSTGRKFSRQIDQRRKNSSEKRRTCDAEGSALDNSKVSSVKLPTILLEFCVTLLIPRLAEASCWTRPGLIRESVVFARCRVEIISRTCAQILYPLVVNLIIPCNLSRRWKGKISLLIFPGQTEIERKFVLFVLYKIINEIHTSFWIFEYV